MKNIPEFGLEAKGYIMFGMIDTFAEVGQIP